MIIPDTNLLLYAYHENDLRHPRASHWWEGLLEGTELIGLPWLVVAGFVRISTNRRLLERPLTVESALEIVDVWFSYPHVSSLNPGSQHVRLFGQALIEAGVGGNLVNDAHIAALAIEYQAEVHSNDNDFARFPGLRWRNPLSEAR